MKITILNYTGQESNWGCKVTSQNLIQLLQTRYGESLVLQYIPIWYSGNTIGKIVNKLRFIFARIVLTDNAILTKLVAIFSLLEGDNISKIKQCDILVVNGEGSLHGYNSSLTKFVHYLAYAKLIGKKICIVNHSLQYDNDKAEKYLRKLYTYSDLNYFREAISLQNSGFAPNKKAFVVPDAAFFNYYVKTQEVNLPISLPNEYICASGSVILRSNHHQYFELLQKLSKYYNLPVIFIASCYFDKQLKDIIQTTYQWAYYDDEDLSVEEVQKLIKDSKFFYSGRFHLNILSAVSAKVFIPFVSNTIKMQGFLNLIDYPIDAINLNNINIEETFTKIVQQITETENTEKKLKQASKQQVEKLEEMYKNFMN